MAHFVDCNTRERTRSKYIIDDYKITEKQFFEEMKKSIDSGLLIDIERGIYIKEGYGALVGICPENCHSLEDLFKFTGADFNRKIVTGKPQTRREWKADVDATVGPYCKIQLPPRFYYKHLAEEDGYDLVIGPGGSVKGVTWNKAVYCRNYLQILEQERLETQIKEKCIGGK